MGKKIWLSMHPRNFCSDKTVRTVFTYVHSFIEAGVNFCILSSPSVSAVNRMDTRTFRQKKNNNKAESLFRLNFNAYIGERKQTANGKVDKFSK